MIPLMILNKERENWHYLAEKKIFIFKRSNIKTSRLFLLLELPSHSFRTENKLKSYEKIC